MTVGKGVISNCWKDTDVAGLPLINCSTTLTEQAMGIAKIGTMKHLVSAVKATLVYPDRRAG